MAAYTREALWLSESSMDFPFHTGYYPHTPPTTRVSPPPISLCWHILQMQDLLIVLSVYLPPLLLQPLHTACFLQEMSMFRGTQENGLALLAPWFDL